MREHLKNRIGAKLAENWAWITLAWIFVPTIAFAIYYNFGRSTGGAVAMIFGGIFLEFITSMIVSLLFDDEYEDKDIDSCAIKIFIVELLSNLFFCFAIVVAKRYNVPPGTVCGAMFALGAIILITGICLLGPEHGPERD